MPAPKMSVIGDSIRLVPAGSPALFELSALGFSSSEIDVQIISECQFVNCFECVQFARVQNLTRRVNCSTFEEAHSCENRRGARTFRRVPRRVHADRSGQPPRGGQHRGTEATGGTTRRQGVQQQSDPSY